MEGSQQEFLEKIKRQALVYRNFFIKVEVLTDMILDKNKEIEKLKEENKKLKNNNQVLLETLWEEDKLGGNVNE